MRTKTQVNLDLEQTTSRINLLQSEIDKNNKELQTLSARRTDLQTELQTAPENAPEGEGAGKKYINRTYRPKDKTKK